jgi:hypothetical protein
MENRKLAMPSYDTLHLARHGKPVSSKSRAAEVVVWNALLEKTIESVGRAMDDFVQASEWQSAAIARDLADALREMKTPVDVPTSPEVDG